ncbi:MAG: hypothetical protein ABIT71_19975 [Vicinamibacteraceae bacterium]
MVDAGQRLRFLQELLGEPRILRRVVEQALDDDRHVVQPMIAGQIDDADAAPTELALDQIPGVDRRSRTERRQTPVDGRLLIRWIWLGGGRHESTGTPLGWNAVEAPESSPLES